MNTGTKITAFAAVLAASFGISYGVGAALDPVRTSAAGATAPATEQAHDTAGTGHASNAADAPGTAETATGSSASAAHPAGGLATSEAGYTLDLLTPRVDSGHPVPLRFLIRDSGGRPLTEYRRAHGKELHLILASRDLTGYRHLHPVRAADGTWSTTVGLPHAGDYRVFADFTPDAEGGRNLTLGTDLSVAGDHRPTGPMPASRTATVDGYTVTLDGDLRAGAEQELRLTVTRDGREVTDLQPYLGAYGHLVALRAGDVAYLHVHPGGAPGDGRTAPGPDVSFRTTAPSAGTYRLFFDFRHNGAVRTAAFTVTAAPGDARADADGRGTGGHGH
ncbi:hypothetical protein [Actinacidiphila sp. bgisy167]|uniref:hypothetical protein n=1 Tax=Actinacidiphila sp. bgisy167 TaxID=3413797 RepID=UPI003D759C62